MIMDKNKIPKLYKEEIEKELKTNKNLSDKERRALKKLLVRAKIEKFFCPKEEKIN